MNKYLAYLHYIGFTQKNLVSFFESDSDFKGFFENLSFQSLSNWKLKDEKIFELMANYKKTDYKKIDDILEKNGVTIISQKDEEYPTLLRNIPNPPFLLYIRGKINNDLDLVSIVGSRKNTRYSQIVLESIIPGLINNSFGIVSGGAFGVDSLAHNIALNNNGYTISVIGTGIDQNYPASNKTLYEKIVKESGTIVSIFRIGTGPDAYNFPIRNEIIAGLSKGTLITEAGEKSGTLITAQLALELNRDVFVIPGEITKETSIGANKLIRDGLGKLVLGYEDILNEYDINFQEKKPKQETKKFEDELEQRIYNTLSKNFLDASSLSDILGIDIEVIGYRLTLLEIGGHIELGNGGNYYVK